MDRKSEGRHRSGRRATERRKDESSDFAGADRRTGEDRRQSLDRRRPL